MQITGTHFNYYLICHRKLWLFANGMSMEQTSDLVYEGKLLHENTYKQRSDKFKEIAIEGIKIDYYDSKNHVVHELKKSDKKEDVHVWQVKYYLFVLERNGIEATGLLEYPKLRKTQEVYLSELDRDFINEAKRKIEKIILSDSCPDRIVKSKCRSCSYYDFCYANES
jgi:CRISPR-associated exonuclease Cas4